MTDRLSLTQEEQDRIRDLLAGLWGRWEARQVAPGTRFECRYVDAPERLEPMGAATVDLRADGWKVASAWMTKDGQILVWRRPFLRFREDDEYLAEKGKAG